MESQNIEIIKGDLNDSQVSLIVDVINYHDSRCEILSRDLFESEIAKRLINSGEFQTWTNSDTEKYVYPNCKKNRWF